MGRDAKEGLDYFSIDMDLFEDHKIILAQELVDPSGNDVRSRLLTPYIAVRLLREIYMKGYYIDWRGTQSLTLSTKIGNGITMVFLNIVANCLIESGFFNKDMYVKYNILTSHGIQKRWKLIVTKLNRKNCVIKSEYKLYTFEKSNPILEMPKSSKEMTNSGEEMPMNEQESATINISLSLVSNNSSNDGNSINNTLITDYISNNIDNENNEESSKEIPKSSKEIPKSSKEIQNIGYMDIEHWLEVYFSTNSMIKTRETVAMMNSMEISILRDWGDAFNRFLISEGTFEKTQSDWNRHFKNWLNLRDKDQNPKNLFNENHKQNGKSTTDSGSSDAKFNGKGHQPFSWESAIGKADKLFGKT